MDLSDRKIKIKGNMKIFLSSKTVEFFASNGSNVAQVVMLRDGKRVIAMINHEGPFLVERYHTSYQTYPIVRKALS